MYWQEERLLVKECKQRYHPYWVSVFVIACVQDIYNYIPATHDVPTVYSVAAVLYTCNVISRAAHVVCFYVSTFSSMCSLPSMAVFCGSLVSCFPGVFLRYCLSDSEKLPAASVITGVTFVFALHMRWISIVKFFYFYYYHHHHHHHHLYGGYLYLYSWNKPCP